MAQKRVALVTGGNRGIGLETVRQLAVAGFTVVLASRDKAKGEAAAASLKGLDISTVSLDVTDAKSVADAVAEVKNRHGRIDVLVNNAGIFIEKQNGNYLSALTADPALAARTLETNVVGALRMIQAVVPIMKAQGYGRIVNVSSRMGQLSVASPNVVGYRASKAALNAVTRVVSAELGDGNIKINSMHPGWVKTDMGGPNAPRTVQEAADTAVWLASLPDNGPTGGFFEERQPLDW